MSLEIFRPRFLSGFSSGPTGQNVEQTNVSAPVAPMYLANTWLLAESSNGDDSVDYVGGKGSKKQETGDGGKEFTLDKLVREGMAIMKHPSWGKFMKSVLNEEKPENWMKMKLKDRNDTSPAALYFQNLTTLMRAAGAYPNTKKSLDELKPEQKKSLIEQLRAVNKLVLEVNKTNMSVPGLPNLFGNYSEL